jgi:replicative superfamily II helicase
VTVNIVDRSPSSERTSREDAFITDLHSVEGESSLVFTQTPRSTQNVVQLITESGISDPTSLAMKLGEWIKLNYHEEWDVAYGTSHGVAIHHGRLPRSLAQLFVRLFDERQITILVCTSTLIEGVNTAAANVLIYDKKINRTDFDFFSFANIRGRGGR